LLFKYFIDKIARDRDSAFQIDAEVMECLKRAPWPGNVRELQNVVERAASMADSGVITLQHLPVELLGELKADHQPPVQQLFSADARTNGGREQWRQFVGNAECQRIVSLLKKHGGNVSVVAREMEISRNTLYRKMRLYNIENR
jgi:transcriptional regulator of acetoin/glycerol metabolism